MAKHYIYKDIRSNKQLFETVQPNYVSIDAVDKMVLAHSGRDPRLDPGRIERQIRVVSDNFKIS